MAPLSISPPRGGPLSSPARKGPDEFLKETFLGWEVGRMSRVEFSRPPRPPPPPDIMGVARAGEEIDREAPKKAESCRRLSWDLAQL